MSCDLLVLQGLRCEWGSGLLNFVLSLSLSHTGHWKFNMAYHGKELSEDLKKRIVALHKDGVGYKKIAKTLKLSCSTVAKTLQRFNRTGSTQNRSWSWSGAAWVLLVLGSYSSLKEPWMSIYTVTYWSRAWSPPVGDWAAGQYSNMITTTALLKKLRVKVICGASANGRWRSARSLTSTSSVMSSWRSGRGFQWQPVKLWWTPCQRG